MMLSIPSLKRNFNEYIWPGLGLFGESYLLFSIGTMRPLWEVLYPKCFITGEICSNNLLSSLTYSVVTGIIIGMIIIGMIAGKIGRRIGSITTAALMALGSVGLTFGSLYSHGDPQAMLKNLVVFLFLFGIGVGGEYPLSASSASERAMSEMKERLQHEQEGDKYSSNKVQSASNTFAYERNRRGKRVILVFSMQGMGIFVNVLTLTLLLFLTGQFGQQVEDAGYYIDDGNANDDMIYAYYHRNNYDTNVLFIIWLAVYAIGTIILIYVLISRVRYLEESSVWENDKQQRQGVINEDKNEYCPPLGETYFIENEEIEENLIEMPIGSSKLRLMFWTYGSRLVGTSFSWLLWDVAFYGNKLFQSSFLYTLAGNDATLIEISSVALLNAFVALLGYYAAAALVDRPSIGRVRLQQLGLLFTGSLFCLCGYLKDDLSAFWLVTIYLGSSFFGQCGPNCTTFLIPAEIFPTEMRTMCHGISAASGKLGALMAAIMFNYLQDSDMFLVSGYCSFLACLVTFITIPESSSLDLHELDKKWIFTLRGQMEEYRGDANEHRHMSTWERFLSPLN